MRLSLGGMVCPTTCGVAGTMTRVITIVFDTPPCVGQLPTRQP